MEHHSDFSDDVIRSKIRSGSITFAGHGKFKIYGKLSCRSGKNMKKENRVFFSSETEAIENGYRPCGHCRRLEYLKWKDGIV